jgi:phytoene dehydrogenase-like protein
MGNPMSPSEDQPDPNPWIEKKKQEFEALQKTGEKTAKIREELVKAIRASDAILAKLSELQKAAQTPETKAQIADLQKQLAKAQQKEYALKLETDEAEAKLREARKHFTEEEPKKPAP